MDGQTDRQTAMTGLIIDAHRKSASRVSSVRTISFVVKSEINACTVEFVLLFDGNKQWMKSTFNNLSFWLARLYFHSVKGTRT